MLLQRRRHAADPARPADCALRLLADSCRTPLLPGTNRVALVPHCVHFLRPIVTISPERVNCDPLFGRATRWLRTVRAQLRSATLAPYFADAPADNHCGLQRECEAAAACVAGGADGPVGTSRARCERIWTRHGDQLRTNEVGRRHQRREDSSRCCSIQTRPCTKLRQMIASGGLDDEGRMPPERTLAVELGVGRRSLRRALEILEQRGRRSPASGPRHLRPGQAATAAVQRRSRTRASQSARLAGAHRAVGGDPFEYILEFTNPLEVIEVRLAIEPVMARLAAFRASQAEINRLQGLVRRYQGRRRSGGLRARRRPFHRTIAESARNALFLSLFDTSARASATPPGAAWARTPIASSASRSMPPSTRKSARRSPPATASARTSACTAISATCSATSIPTPSRPNRRREAGGVLRPQGIAPAAALKADSNCEYIDHDCDPVCPAGAFSASALALLGGLALPRRWRSRAAAPHPRLQRRRRADAGADRRPLFHAEFAGAHQSCSSTGCEGPRLPSTGFALDRRCRPIPHALLDLWHCDADGRYDNDGYRLRGHQFTDAQGRFVFETIVPASYPGRTRHYHVKVQAPGGNILTTQLYFPGEPGNAATGSSSHALLLDIPLGRGPNLARYDFVTECRMIAGQRRRSLQHDENPLPHAGGGSGWGKMQRKCTSRNRRFPLPNLPRLGRGDSSAKRGSDELARPDSRRSPGGSRPACS